MSTMWFLTYQAAPEPGSDDFGTCGGAFINCWIVAESQAAAEAIAVPELAGFGWSISDRTDAAVVDVTRYEYSEQALEYIAQAEIDGSVYSVYRWPA